MVSVSSPDNRSHNGNAITLQPVVNIAKGRIYFNWIGHRINGNASWNMPQIQFKPKLSSGHPRKQSPNSIILNFIVLEFRIGNRNSCQRRWWEIGSHIQFESIGLAECISRRRNVALTIFFVHFFRSNVGTTIKKGSPISLWMILRLYTWYYGICTWEMVLWLSRRRQ